MNATRTIRNIWLVATVTRSGNELVTGERVVVRWAAPDRVECLARGGRAVALTLRDARQTLECQRGRDLRPTVAIHQARLSLRWVEMAGFETRWPLAA